MEPQVTFDKSIYFAGDMVTARFMIPERPHKNSRTIELRLQSGENVGVTYSSGSGKSRTTHTAWENSIYAENVTNIPVDENTQFPLEYTMSYQLPQNNSENMSANNFSVFHEGMIKIDVARRVDPNYHFPIPIIALPPKIDKTPVSVFTEEVDVKLRELKYLTNDIFQFEFIQKQDIKYRQLRVEIKQILHKRAHRHTEYTQHIHVFEKFDPQYHISSEFEIPELPFSTIIGDNFSIETTLKFVIDKKLSKDDNLDIILPYFKATREQIGDRFSNEVLSNSKCPSCSHSNIGNATFCEECGNSLQ